MLINAKLEEGQTFSREQLIIELDGIVFAGHDTTAITLTWIFYHLAQNREVERPSRTNDREPKRENQAHKPILNPNEPGFRIVLRDRKSYAGWGIVKIL